MSLTVALSATILDTILARLALLFLIGADGDLGAAREAARQMLAAYHPQTEDELRLAAEIVSFSFQALEALGQAATPDMPLARILRLRGSAVSLSRESHKFQRKLDQLQRDRRAGTRADGQPATPQPATEPSRPQIDKAIALIEATRQAMQVKGSDATWTQSYQQRQTAKRIAENLRKNQASHTASANHATASTPSPTPAHAMSRA